jgi:hypothetical protein
MFWWNLFLFGVLLLAVGVVLVLRDYEYWGAFFISCAVVHATVCMIFGIPFFMYNDVASLQNDPECLEAIKHFASNQTRINSLSSEVQAFIGVEEKFAVMPLIMNAIIVFAIVITMLIGHGHDVFYLNAYKVFNNFDIGFLIVEYKFSTFKKVFEVMSLAERKYFDTMEDYQLLYRDFEEDARYEIHFNYIDYIRYRWFLSRLAADKKYAKPKQSREQIIRNTLEFNRVLVRDLKKEAERPFEDLVKK